MVNDQLLTISKLALGYYQSGIINVNHNGLDVDFEISDCGIPFELGETFIIDFNSLTLSHTPALVKKFNGLGQVFTNLLRYNYNLQISP